LRGKPGIIGEKTFLLGIDETPFGGYNETGESAKNPSLCPAAFVKFGAPEMKKQI
jgi:hypothetical protein